MQLAVNWTPGCMISFGFRRQIDPPSSCLQPLPPSPVLDVPPHGLLEHRLEVLAGAVAQSRRLAEVQGVPPVVARPVVDVLYERFRLPQGLQDAFRYLDIGPLLAAADIVAVSYTHLTLPKNREV